MLVRIGGAGEAPVLVGKEATQMAKKTLKKGKKLAGTKTLGGVSESVSIPYGEIRW